MLFIYIYIYISVYTIHNVVIIICELDSGNNSTASAPRCRVVKTDKAVAGSICQWTDTVGTVQSHGGHRHTVIEPWRVGPPPPWFKDKRWNSAYALSACKCHRNQYKHNIHKRVRTYLRINTLQHVYILRTDWARPWATRYNKHTESARPAG